ncbi:MAG: hypothetical protein O6939_00680 [Bacteroidetes bacterium]|nr:hypothetical protein [Bacteroidota bacterium]
MMKDELEKFIKKNRTEFDSELPSENVWDRIWKSMYGTNKPRAGNYNWIWKAAAILLFATSSYLLIERNYKQSPVSEPLSSIQWDDQFEETEAYYFSLIEEKREVVKKLGSVDTQLFSEFDSELASLDLMYGELKHELIATGNQVIIDAMIANLQLRIELLNREFEILKKIKTQKNEHHHSI